jgi:UDP-N-acetylglucosamine transferase subunit ALG13
MIFVTVGSDWPFDRLIRDVDSWASANSRSDVFAQIAGRARYKPTAMQFSEYLEPAEFSRRMSEASVIIAHAGMGTILTALRLQKPIIVFPRRAELREIRNEHQLATARHLSQSTNNIAVAFNEEELRAELDRIDTLEPSEGIADYASEPLLQCLRDFIISGK